MKNTKSPITIHQILTTFSSLSTNRSLALAAVVGSQNYNLQTPNSDVDLKFFVFPSFEDLYRGEFYTHSQTSPNLDCTVHDIRKLPEFLKKSGINFLEIPFSVALFGDKRLVTFLQQNRESIAKNNLKGLYSSAKGTMYNKQKLLYKGTSTTKPFVEEYGYDAKELHHIFRISDLLCRYYAFRSFAMALRFEEGDTRQFLLNLKNYSLPEIGVLGQQAKNKAHVDLMVKAILDIFSEGSVTAEIMEEFYMKGQAPSDKDVIGELRELVQEMVRENLE